MDNLNDEFEELLNELVEAENHPSLSTFPILSPIDRERNGKTETTKKWKKSTRRPPFRPTYMPQLRIFRRDIRRKYAEMIVNVLNSHNIHLLHQFLQQFFLPTFEMRDIPISDQITKQFQWPRHFTGFHRFLQAMNMFQEAFPDSVYSLEDVKIFIALNEKGSRLVATVKGKRTQLYDVRFLGELKEAERVDENQHPSYQLIPLGKPLMNEIEGKFCIKLDENHYVESICIHFQKYEFK